MRTKVNTGKGATRYRARIIPYIILLRPYQHIKNLFVFAPLFFAGRMAESFLLYKSAIAFLVFSFAAGSVYIFNDYRDRAEDREHPVKKHRPLASGEVSEVSALYLAGLLLITGLVLMLVLDVKLFPIIGIYILLNVFYSMGLKHISLLDIFMVAIGFVLRIYAGHIVTQIYLSVWIIIITFLLALFLAVAKRRDDILLSKELRKVRKSIDGYNLIFVNGAMTIMATVIMVSYIMYTISTEVTSRLHSNSVYMTSVFVLFGILRYMQITLVEEKAGDPTKVLFSDTLIQITVLSWIVSFALIIYHDLLKWIF
jgi:decaprenyl-phosphate phosphoribosyltransferase